MLYVILNAQMLTPKYCYILFVELNVENFLLLKLILNLNWINTPYEGYAAED